MVRPIYIYNNNQQKIALSIKKSIGTLNKVLQMIEQDVYCADVAQQINASIGLLRSANHDLLKDHLACCRAKSLHTGWSTAVDFIEEFARVRDMSNRK